jgi:tetratricopeptide (TPR) repeat protein
MNLKSGLGLCVLAALVGCAVPAKKPITAAEPAPAPNFAREVKRPPPPTQELTNQVLYETLLAEVALQRGDAALATRAYLDLLEKTQDYRIAERATQVALQSRMPDEALVAARKWLELEPESVAARQTVAALLVSKGRLDEAKPHLEKLLAAEEANVGVGFMHLNNLLARHPDKQAVLALVRELAQPYPKLPEAHFAVARAAWSAGKGDEALRELHAALELRPAWEGAALFQAQILQSQAPAEALKYYESYLRQHGQAREMRLAYARFLVQQKEYGAARGQFQQLVQDFPNNPEVPLAVGLISMQMGEYDVAEQYLKQALEGGVKDGDAVRLYLGQIAEERKRYDEALEWYGSVEGEQAFSAKLRSAAVLAKQDKLAEARDYLHRIVPANNQQRVQLVEAESQLLREAKQYEEAFNVLTRALEKLPNHPDLLYDQAMAAEKIDRLDIVESSLRKLIQIKPDYAHAYNALGYTLADRTTRYDEAKQLLEKALKLAPEDPFILDSMGWLYYRMKDYDQAIGYLRRALAIRADPEIAAHLGEVLWVKGEHAAAEQVWNTALKSNPKHEVLLGVIHRFKPAKP